MFPHNAQALAMRLPRRNRTNIKKVVNEAIDDVTDKAALDDTLEAPNMSYVEPSFDPHKIENQSDDVLNEYPKIPASDSTQSIPIASADSTQVEMELQRIASLPEPIELFPKPLAQSSTKEVKTQGWQYFQSYIFQFIKIKYFADDITEVKIPELTDEQTPTPTTSMLQDNEESNVWTKADIREDPVSCQFCSSRSFESRDKLLTHLTLVHYIKDIQDKFPYEVNI